MQNSKGFSLIETLVALSILLAVITAIIPIKTRIMMERDVLDQKRAVLNTLHEELQDYLWSGASMQNQSYTINVDGSPVRIHFTTENSYLKGCAEWKNVKNKQDESCLYGYPTE
ncbi:competence type IV pilus minor pilin ComGE [Virgibacillus siamensis]|uniref:competence type IV pilus minor pilin ComGE n=1 Tax=Virgibacillus siamensis TaxID=480071 RepID=UPI00158D9547|nr:competence type IV pilus minor pilin ComGE [Virgibacillus siamensis]